MLSRTDAGGRRIGKVEWGGDVKWRVGRSWCCGLAWPLRSRAIKAVSSVALASVIGSALFSAGLDTLDMKDPCAAAWSSGWSDIALSRCGRFKWPGVARGSLGCSCRFAVRATFLTNQAKTSPALVHKEIIADLEELQVWEEEMDGVESRQTTIAAVQYPPPYRYYATK